MPPDLLHFSPRLTVLPIIHGSGDFAVEVRRVMLSREFDGLAVPLPASFQEDVERAIGFLPGISAVVQHEARRFSVEPWSPERDLLDEDDDLEMEMDERRTASFVPIDPCQGVIAALRIAVGEHLPRHFIDLETERFEPLGAVLPDPYALKQTQADKFAAAVLPAIPRLPAGQPQDRVVMMARRLRELEERYRSILFVCSIMDWPWIREAYNERVEPAAEDELVEETEILAVDPATTIFLLGELPFITGLYERARAELEYDENLSIDGIKELLLVARQRYEDDLKKRARPITPKLLSSYFQYVRNLALVERRMTPDLYTLVVAAQQIAGDQFAIHLLETAREYPDTGELPFQTLKMGIDEARWPDGDVLAMKSRLPGQVRQWRSCELKPLPPKLQQQKWAHGWNPFGQCSWPPEDTSIERFRTHVKDTAMALLGNDLARVEKFTTSLKDGLDIRETLRNWHTGDLFVKVFPPARGSLDCVVMLFDSPADPREYPWRITWHAEHHDESTLALFASDFRQQIVGPGIALATYGGALFLFPPRPVPDVWRDRRFDFCDTLEERLLAAACYHTQEKHVALLSHAPPGPGWRRLAKKYDVRLVHVPLSRFSQATIQQLRMFHVLNGKQVRSFAAHFIRKA
ncbi:MAG TPA: hypothetical protein VML55_13190 [Planctomycetaceae bacterium]|nr:hypothetical protein [Planctomycetaceae bacterium]